jgi:ribosomal protein S18 acetylase RimI-like enzyme
MALDGDEIDQLYLRPGRTGEGLGSRLVELAKERWPDGLSLYTFQANTGARRFYERHGFVVVDLNDGARNKEHQPEVRYAWRPVSTPG